MSRHKAVRWLCWIAFIAASLLILVLVTPYLVSAYHLEAGGRALDNPELLAYNPLPALEHLQKAIEWQPDNAQAYRLLAKVHRAQGDLLAAIETLTRYTELRPDNPLAHIELAEVYEAIEAEMRPCIWPTWSLPCRRRRWISLTPGRVARRGAVI